MVLDMKKLSMCMTLIFAGCYVGAQTPPQSEFEKWQQNRAKQFNTYLSEQDQEFSQFLKQRWLVKDIEQAPKKQTLPKIKTPPIAPKKKPKLDDSETIKVIPPKVIEKPKKPVAQPEPTKEPSKGLEFLGHKLSLVDVNLPSLSLFTIDEDSISTSWQKMAERKQPKLLTQLTSYAEELNLDDWARAILTYQAIERLAEGLSQNEVNLYTWYYIVQQGFDSRIGYQGRMIYLLMKVDQPLYGQKFFRFGEDKYYFINFAEQGQLGHQIKTYQNQHAQAKAGIQINLGQVPKLNGPQVSRELKFRYAGQEHKVLVPYHQKYVELLNYYPQMDLQHYFQTELEAESKQALLSYLAEAIAGKTEQQALNFLLRFVQKSLAYQTDDQQFNEENFLLATETLHYPYADCEDRAVLFAYLVKNLLGNKIIGVLYKGHIATAIKTNSEIDGAGYRVNGEKYLVADPTYIGADIGDVMPGYEKQSPKLITIN